MDCNSSSGTAFALCLLGSDTNNSAVICLEFDQMLKYLPPDNAYDIANRAEPGQTTPLGAV